MLRHSDSVETKDLQWDLSVPVQYFVLVYMGGHNSTGGVGFDWVGWIHFHHQSSSQKPPVLVVALSSSLM